MNLTLNTRDPAVHHVWPRTMAVIRAVVAGMTCTAIAAIRTCALRPPPGIRLPQSEWRQIRWLENSGHDTGVDACRAGRPDDADARQQAFPYRASTALYRDLRRQHRMRATRTGPLRNVLVPGRPRRPAPWPPPRPVLTSTTASLQPPGHWPLTATLRPNAAAGDGCTKF